MGAPSITAVPPVGGLALLPADLRPADGLAAKSVSVGGGRTPTSSSFAQQLSRHSQNRVDDTGPASRHAKPAGALAQPPGTASTACDAEAPPGDAALATDSSSSEIGMITGTAGDASTLSGAQAPDSEFGQTASPAALSLAQWIAGLLPAAAPRVGANDAAVQATSRDEDQPTATTQPAQPAALAAPGDLRARPARPGVAAGTPALRGAALTLATAEPLRPPGPSAAAVGELPTEAQASPTSQWSDDHSAMPVDRDIGALNIGKAVPADAPQPATPANEDDNAGSLGLSTLPAPAISPSPDAAAPSLLVAPPITGSSQPTPLAGTSDRGLAKPAVSIDPRATPARPGVAASKPAPRGATPTLATEEPLAPPGSSAAAVGKSATEVQATSIKPSPDDQPHRAPVPAADAPQALASAMPLAAPVSDSARPAPDQTPALRVETDAARPAANAGARAMAIADRGAMPLRPPASSAADVSESATEMQATSTKSSPDDQPLKAPVPAADAPQALASAMPLAAPVHDSARPAPDQTPALRVETDAVRARGNARAMAMADHGPAPVDRGTSVQNAEKVAPAAPSQPANAADEQRSAGASDPPRMHGSAFSHLLDAAAQSLAVAPPTAGGSQAPSGAAAVDVSLATPVMSPEFREALGVQVSVLARDGVHHAELHLNPSDMGPISVRIALDGTQAQVDFGVDTAATRALVESGLPELASALREAGLTLTGGGVSQHARGQAGDGWGDRQRDGNPSGQTGRQGDPAGSASEDDGGTSLPRPRSVRVVGGVDLYA